MSWLEFCAGMRSSGRAARDAMEDIFKSTATEKDKSVLEEHTKRAREQFDMVAGADGIVDIIEFFKNASTVPLFKEIGFAVAAGEDGKLTFDEFVKALKENGNIP